MAERFTSRERADIQDLCFFTETVIHLQGERFTAENRKAYLAIASRLRKAAKEDLHEALRSED
jgi:hypothetical protein